MKHGGHDGHRGFTENFIPQVSWKDKATHVYRYGYPTIISCH